MKKVLFLTMIAFCLNLAAENGDKALDSKVTLLEGTVYDENNDPLTGALIYIDNMAISTTTDMEGKFSLDIEKNILENEKVKISVTYIGHSSQKIQVSTNNESPMNIDFILSKKDMPESIKSPVLPLPIPLDRDFKFKVIPVPEKMPKNGIREEPNPKFILCE